MKEKTLAKAKELEEDIRDIRMAMTESSNARHFAMLEHYGYDARRQNLPKWLTPKIMEMLGEERERLEYELENLTDDNYDEPTNFEPMGKYNVGQKANEIEPSQEPKLMGYWKFLFIIAFIALNILCGIQFVAIRKYQQSEDKWVKLSELWRERLDTCANRNERLFNELYELRSIRVNQLKEQGKED